MVRQGGQGEVGFGWSRLGMARQGGRGEMCFGFIGFGIVCSRRSRCVVFGYGELR
jgi:hypothetical protein